MAGSIYFQFQFWKSYTVLCRAHGGWEGLEATEKPEQPRPLTNPNPQPLTLTLTGGV